MSADEIDPSVTYHGITTEFEQDQTTGGRYIEAAPLIPDDGGEGEWVDDDARAGWPEPWDATDYAMAFAFVALVALALIGVIVAGVYVFTNLGFR